MYQNRNMKFLFDLSNKNYKTCKTRNRICIVAIALTSFLIVSTFSIGASYIDSFKLHQLQVVGTTGMASLKNPTEEQLQTLKSNENIKYVGVRKEVVQGGSVQYQSDAKTDALYYAFRYYDNTEWNKHRIPTLENVIGRYPENENEIMLPNWALNKMGNSHMKIGESLNFSYLIDGEKYQNEFILTGYFDEYDNYSNSDSMVYALVSQKFCDDIDKRTAQGVANTLADITFFNELEEIQIQELENSLHLDKDQIIRYNPSFKLENKWEIAIAFLGVILAIVICGYLLIYNIFYISVTNNIHFYARLKVIGVTGKQIVSTMLLQSMKMAIVGIVIGEIIGYAFSSIIIPMAVCAILEQQAGIVVNCNVWVLIATFVFTVITVAIASLKPASIAGKISPIDSMKYEIISSKKKKCRNRKKSLSLEYLAISSVLGNKKRFSLVLMSITFGIVACLLVSVMVSGMNTDAFVQGNMDSDIELKNKTVSLGYEDEFKQVFSETFLNQLDKLTATLSYTTVKQRMIAPIYSKDTLGAYLEKTKVIDEELNDNFFAEHPEMFYSQLVGIIIDEKMKERYADVNWEEFEKGNICLIASNDKNIIDMGDVISFKLANFEDNKVKAILEDETNSIAVGGYISEEYNYVASIRSSAPNLFVSQKYLQGITKDALTTKIMINAKEGNEEAANSEVNQLVCESNYMGDIVVTSALEKKEGLKRVKQTLYCMGGGLALVFVFIGILNFINVIFTSVVERQRELTIMESIGYTKKQIIRKIRIESLVYVVSSLIATFTVGTGIIMLVFPLYKNIVEYALFTYPYVLMMLITLLLFAVCYIVPGMALRKDFKMTTVERLRLSEK